MTTRANTLAFADTFKSPIGDIGLFYTHDKKLARVTLPYSQSPAPASLPRYQCDSIINAISAYFDSPYHRLDEIEHAEVLTPFQCKMYKLIRQIQPGHTATYGEIAAICQSGPRGVGQALRANPLPLIYPCHRVVSQSGLGGFGGKPTHDKQTTKQWLLNFELNATCK